MASNYDIESIGLQDPRGQFMIWINVDFYHYLSFELMLKTCWIGVNDVMMCINIDSTLKVGHLNFEDVLVYPVQCGIGINVPRISLWAH